MKNETHRTWERERARERERERERDGSQNCKYCLPYYIPFVFPSDWYLYFIEFEKNLSYRSMLQSSKRPVKVQWCWNPVNLRRGGVPRGEGGSPALPSHYQGSILDSLLISGSQTVPTSTKSWIRLCNYAPEHVGLWYVDYSLYRLLINVKNKYLCEMNDFFNCTYTI